MQKLTIQDFRHKAATEIMGWKSDRNAQDEIWWVGSKWKMRQYTPDKTIEQAIELYKRYPKKDLAIHCYDVLHGAEEDDTSHFDFDWWEMAGFIYDFLNPLAICQAIAKAQRWEVEWDLTD